MSGPGGREVERISVKVVPDTDGFRAEVKREIEKAERDKVEIKVEIDDKRVKKQLRDLGKDLKVRIRTELEKSDLKKMSRDLAAFGKAQPIDIQGELGSKTQKKIRTQIREVVSGNSFTVQGFLSSASMRKINEQLREFGKKTEVKFTAKMDTWAAKKEIADLSERHHVNIRADLDATAANAELRLITRPRDVSIRARFNRSRFGQIIGFIGKGITGLVGLAVKTMDKVESAITGAVKTISGAIGDFFRGFAQSVPKIGALFHVLGVVIQGVFWVTIIPAIVAAVEAALALAGAFALALAPVLFIAAGIAFAAMAEDIGGEAAKLKDNLEKLKGSAKDLMATAIEPMAKTLNDEILPDLNRWIKSMKGPLTDAFKAASQHIQPLVDGLKRFTEEALGGLIIAMNSPGMKDAMKGLKTLLGDVGSALGSFFATLSNYGPDFKKTLEALGQALVDMAPSFANLLGSMAKIAPGLIEKIAAGLIKIMDTLAKPEVQKAIEKMANWSIDAIVDGIVWLLEALPKVVAFIEAVVLGWQWLVHEVRVAIQNVQDAWDRFKEWLKQTWENIKTAVGNAVAGMVQDIIYKITGIKVPINNIKQWFHDAWEFVKTTARNAWDIIKFLVMQKVNEIKTGAGNAVKAIVGFFQGMADSINGIIAGIKTGLQGLKDAANAAKNTIGSIALPGIIGLEMPDLEQGVKFTPRNSPAGFGDFGSFDSATASWRRDTRRMRLQQLRAAVPNVGSGNTYNVGDIYPTTETTPQAIMNAFKRMEAIHGTA